MKDSAWNIFTSFISDPKSWIGAAVALLIFLATRWLGRFKAKRIICRELKLDNLLRVGQDVAGEVEIRFAGNLIRSLWVYEFEVTNPTNENIDNIEILVDFGQRCHILQKKFQVTPKAAEKFKVTLDPNGRSKCKILIECLNSSKHHNHKVIVKFHCDSDLAQTSITGMGVGWSVLHKRFKLPRSLAEIFFNSLVSFESLTVYVLVGWVVNGVAFFLIYSLYFGYKETDYKANDSIPFIGLSIAWLLLILLLRWVAVRSPVWAKGDDLRWSILFRQYNQELLKGKLFQTTLAQLTEEVQVFEVDPPQNEQGDVPTTKTKFVPANQVVQRQLKRRKSPES